MGVDPGTKTDIEIVGVVKDTQVREHAREIPYELYIPYPQMDSVHGMTRLRARGRATPGSCSTRCARAVQRGGFERADVRMRTLEQQLDKSLMSERLLASLSTVFGVLATLLAAIGLYGVMAYMVARRTREIGIRMALGASGGSVVWLVMREVLLLAGIGVAIGLAGAFAATRLVQTQLFGIMPTDALTMVAGAMGIAGVAALAGYLPARRATTIDPMIALRWE